MADAVTKAIVPLLAAHEAEVVKEWLQRLREDVGFAGDRMREGELGSQCTRFLRELRQGLEAGATTLDSAPFAALRVLLTELSASRATQGFSPRETAVFVFALKQPLFDMLRRHGQVDAAAAQEANWSIGLLLDSLGLFTMETYQRTRESLIVRQQQEIAELSTPVIKLWDGILALPLIGALDSQRTQVVMESLLDAIVQYGAATAIIDITGVPTVDTLTAQHLLKTVSAARLMGADCIISGIRPQIAQTMVHLGVELTVVSKATLADAFALALSRTGRTVVRAKAADAATRA